MSMRLEQPVVRLSFRGTGNRTKFLITKAPAGRSISTVTSSLCNHLKTLTWSLSPRHPEKHCSPSSSLLGTAPQTNFPSDGVLFGMGHKSFWHSADQAGTDRPLEGSRAEQFRTQTGWLCRVALQKCFLFYQAAFCSVTTAAHSPPSEQQEKTKTAVHAGCSSCSHSSAALRIPGVIKYLGGLCRPLYHGQKCRVLRFGAHWALVPAS